ncbi:MAG: GNAT family N-acetyltransferase [bacterium]|nr:GNAT family N-acetyltransferase [bacterium]
MDDVRFPLVDEFLWTRMDVDPSRLAPGRIVVFESPRRVNRELGYGYVGGCWIVRFLDGRAAASVPPGTGAACHDLLGHLSGPEDIRDPETMCALKEYVNRGLAPQGVRPVNREFVDVFFACNRDHLRRDESGTCRRLTDLIIPPAEGLGLPTQCFPDGICYGVVEEGEVASVAYAHRTGCMEDRVADLGVVTAPGHRRRGFAKTAVSAVVDHITRNGGEARYACRPDNHASIATARSVGFVPYGTSLKLTAPAPDFA